MTKKPKLIAFDLDYTLWPFWVDTHVDPPFRKDGSGDIIDMQGRNIKCYKEVPEVLKRLHTEGYLLTVASRTSEIDGALQLVKLHGWDKYFSILEIYPGCKITHFNKLKTKTGLDFSEMLFFDDEHRNKIDLQKIGVHTILVKDGVTENLVKDGLQEYAQRFQ
ncbi:Magnesium-dependent phosphatase 1 [Armadillidium nasatum]|uniref:Magnesium-dependent phosphatase 1 n=1 Tax=Armadillidium nasatum TaxID=96803 RepID=A0A5N5SN75_9CRUS|nr:Magnesium-dependent phosphatase 1 [Armadillidium nasatum]